MSIGMKIKGLFGGSETRAVVDPALQLLVVDSAGMAEGQKKGSGLTPRGQIDILQALSRINKREKLEMKVVFIGEPLRKVGHGERFDDVQVFFAEDENAYRGLVMEQVKAGQRGFTVTLITADADLEKRAEGMGVTTLRVSTFKKSFDDFRSSGGKGRSGGGRNNSRRSGGGESSGGGGNRRRSGGNRSRAPRQPKSEAVGGSDVSDLIDLVE